MITQQEVDKLIQKKVIDDTDAIQVVRKYLFDKTGKDIKGINKPTGQVTIKRDTNGLPLISTDIELLFEMYFIAKAHYLEIKK